MAVADTLSVAYEEEKTSSILEDEQSLSILWKSATKDGRKLVLDHLNLNEKQNLLWNTKTESTENIEIHQVVEAGIPTWSTNPATFFYDESFIPDFAGNFLRALHLFGSRSENQLFLSRVRQKVLAVAIYRLKASFGRQDSGWRSLLDEVVNSLSSPNGGSLGKAEPDKVRKTWSDWAKLGSRYAEVAKDLGSNGVLLVLPDDISDSIE
ncbi:hypothetical protein B0T25DRAFT_629749 [Lasiosphaeria hispida]|uniref:Uncharacterized protein n=1 Tax=Lasiosphaeria hispida TaxID=260671 RepID=A0AAJ0HJY6_9PEZI|nr:hypothetical protein B0T25DRAFT_629749 [Lasiosphaeria hispida]